MQDHFERLTHLVYDASLDNSMWPELILELTEQLEILHDALPQTERRSSVSNLVTHFRRAFGISERIVALQEEQANLNAVLDALALGVVLLDDHGHRLFQNKAIGRHPEIERLFSQDDCALLECADTAVEQSLVKWVTQVNRSERPNAFVVPNSGTERLLLLPRREAIRMGFPTIAAAVLLATDVSNNDGVKAFAARHGLSPRETDLMNAICLASDLRQAATDIGVSYESARTYIKHIYQKTGCRSQVELIQSLRSEPMNMLRKRGVTPEETYKVRRQITLSDGRTLEYFTLGPADGIPVVHFDALAGLTVDAIGNPAGVLRHLMRDNIRLITPCRPGGFRSTPKEMTSLRNFSPDIVELLDQLGIDRFSIFSVSFGAGSALAVAHDLQDRIDRVVLSSPSYPAYRPENWRDYDLFYQMSGVLGRRWPGMLKQILPLLIRSVMQNVDRYFDRYIKTTKSKHDIATLSNPHLRRRMTEMLAERTAGGMSGMVDENVLNAQGWDFDPADIAVTTEIFHGELDNVSPPAGARLLASHLPNCTLVELPKHGHYHHVTGWPWLISRAAGHATEPDAFTNVLPDG